MTTSRTICGILLLNLIFFCVCFHASENRLLKDVPVKGENRLLKHAPVNVMVIVSNFLIPKEILNVRCTNQESNKIMRKAMLNDLKLKYGNALPFFRNWSNEKLISLYPEMCDKKAPYGGKFSYIEILETLTEDKILHGSYFENIYYFPDVGRFYVTYNNEESMVPLMKKEKYLGYIQNGMYVWKPQSHPRNRDGEKVWMVPESKFKFCRSGHKNAIKDVHVSRNIFIWKTNEEDPNGKPLPFFENNPNIFAFLPETHDLIEIFANDAHEFFVRLKSKDNGKIVTTPLTTPIKLSKNQINKTSRVLEPCSNTSGSFGTFNCCIV